MRIVIGIGGGIAAYKAVMLLRLFSEAGHETVAIPTEAALKFVGRPTFEALSGNPVSSSVFERVDEVNHVRQAEWADAIVVAPATADLLSRLASGRADDLLSATVLTTHAPIILVPAMHTQMWEHPATQRNLLVLRRFGYHVVEPAVGRLTGSDSGIGRLPEPEEIFNRVCKIIGDDALPPPANQPLAGYQLIITAGGTREALDPVRFLGNRSSGKQGIALAEEARNLGADVILIHAHIEVDIPTGIQAIAVSSADQLRYAVLDRLKSADAVIMAAAVADFRPKTYTEFKIKKTNRYEQTPVIELVQNPDILSEIVAYRRENPASAPATIVGFAAETGEPDRSVLELGRAKLKRKGCDYLAVNTVGENLGFGTDENTLLILSAETETPLEISGSKNEVARALLLHTVCHIH